MRRLQLAAMVLVVIVLLDAAVVGTIFVVRQGYAAYVDAGKRAAVQRTQALERCRSDVRSRVWSPAWQAARAEGLSFELADERANAETEREIEKRCR